MTNDGLMGKYEYKTLLLVCFCFVADITKGYSQEYDDQDYDVARRNSKRNQRYRRRKGIKNVKKHNKKVNGARDKKENV